jgi:hypothetical protein
MELTRFRYSKTFRMQGQQKEELSIKLVGCENGHKICS